MLVLTEAAAEVVKSVTPAPQATSGGLRIASSTPAPAESPDALRVTTAAGPGDDDQVIETAGARVFLDSQVTVYLDDKILDAQVDEQGKAQFTLGVQGSGQA